MCEVRPGISFTTEEEAFLRGATNRGLAAFWCSTCTCVCGIGISMHELAHWGHHNICTHWRPAVDVVSRPRHQSCRMSKIRRKVTVENSKTISDSSSSSSTTTTTTTTSTSNPAGPSRRPSVFERLGPSTGSNAADVRVQWLIIHPGPPDSELGGHPRSHHVFVCLLFFCFRVIAEIG